MNPTQALSRAGQSLWLDNITRELLTSGTLARYIDELSVTGLTSNPTIFDQAIKNGTAYDASIRERVRAGMSGEKLFFEIALEDITRAADLFRPVHERTAGVDGWVSLEVSPLLAHDTQNDAARGAGSACARRPAQRLHQDSGNARRAAGDRGSDLRGRSDQRDAAVLARAVRRGGRSLAARRRAPDRGEPEPDRRLRGVDLRQPVGCRGRGQGSGGAHQHAGHRDRQQRAYRAYSQLLESTRWRRAFNAGARPQRLLFREHGHEGPKASDILYIKGLVAPLTVNTMPEGTLKAFADHGELGAGADAPMAATPRRCLREFRKAGVDLDALAAKLQDEGAASFVASWNALLGVIASKGASLAKAS